MRQLHAVRTDLATVGSMKLNPPAPSHNTRSGHLRRERGPSTGLDPLRGDHRTAPTILHISPACAWLTSRFPSSRPLECCHPVKWKLSGNDRNATTIHHGPAVIATPGVRSTFNYDPKRTGLPADRARRQGFHGQDGDGKRDHAPPPASAGGAERLPKATRHRIGVRCDTVNSRVAIHHEAAARKGGSKPCGFCHNVTLRLPS